MIEQPPSSTMLDYIPQIIMIALFAMSLGISLNNHGLQRTVRTNFFNTFLAVSMNVALLYLGGFFK